MVLIAASICTKSGKVILSRQFVDVSKPRIEGLLTTFLKLVPGEKQHTFFETNSARFLYQPMDKIHMLLITTKASNILEDLETLRLFSKVVSEYCRNMEDQEISENAFNIMFAFDEIVALGYRENVNLAQIRTFVEMDSHEEKVYQAIRQMQEKEAKNKMREKAKELHHARMKKMKKGLENYAQYQISNINSCAANYDELSGAEMAKSVETNLASIQSSTVQTRSLKLTRKVKNVDSFMNQLQFESQVAHY